MKESSTPQLNKTWFYFLIFYLIIDYVRPQDVIPVIRIIKPGIIAILVLSIYIVSNSAYWFKLPHIRIIWYTVVLVVCLVPFASNGRYAYEIAKVMVTYMPCILSIVACLVDLKTLRKYINISILIMIYVALTGISSGGKGTGGYFYDENDISLYINTVLPFCYFFLIYQKDFLWRLVYLSGLVLGVTANVISFSRGGFLGMAVITLGIWLFGKRKVASLVVFSLVATGMYFVVGDSYIAEIKSITDTSGTTSESTANWRLMAWDSGIRMFLDNPMGVGGNNFGVRLPEYQPDDVLRLDWGRPAHSLWFTLLPELGFIGTILFFRLMYCVFKDLIIIIKSPPLFEDPDYAVYYSTSLALICGCLGFFASGTFLSVLYYPHFWYYAAIVAAMKRIQLNKTETYR